jgi:glyoxylase-like metal-dependent hydrolase (beta-lactamase superfamily II)
MFPRPSLWRNLSWLGLVLAFLGGCTLEKLVRVRRVDLDPRVVLFLGGGGNSLVLLHGGEAFLVDPKFSGMARQLRVDVEQQLGREVRRLLLTHSHVDHTGGLPLYPRAGAVLAHPATIRRVQADGQRAPFVEVERELLLTLGGEPIRVLYLGRGHTDGDLVAFLETRKLLVSGDLVVQGWEPNIDVEAGGAALEWKGTLDHLLALPFEKVMPGHGELMTRAEVEHFRDYFQALEGAVREGKAKGLDEEAVAKTVTVAGFDDLAPLPGGVNRERNLRLMYRALSASEAAPPDAGTP